MRSWKVPSRLILCGVLSSTSIFRKTFCDNSHQSEVKAKSFTSSEIDKDLRIMKEEMSKRLPTSVQNPDIKTTVSIHGSTSAGKSSFINDIFGFEVKAHNPEKVDDNVTLIVTVKPDIFEDYFKKQLNQGNHQISIKSIQEEIKRKSWEDLHSPLKGNDLSDPKKKYIFLALDPKISQNFFSSHGLTELTNQVSPQSTRLRTIIINESIYENEHIFTHPSDKIMLKKDRINLAKSLIVIDTPGVENNASYEEELKAILSQISHSFFLVDIGSGFEGNNQALRVYTNALLKKGKEIEIWDKSTFLLTKLDTVLPPSPSHDAHSPLHQRWYEFGTLFNTTSMNMISAPTFHRCFFIGLPRYQQHHENLVIGSLPDVYQRLNTIISRKQSLDYQKIVCIYSMAKELEKDLREHPTWTDYGRYLWLGDIISGDFLSYERPYAIARHFLEKYGEKIKPESEN